MFDIESSRSSLLTPLRLAQNLYRSNARFLFELIQNAEDNNYSRAKALGSEPYIKFTIRPNTIVIDCNEDGFTPANVKAICRIGESTKIRENAQYYIGEKGIGFKSVFMVASKVHIQSGPFSFFFEHEPGNNGMGMITPVWEHTDTTLEEPLTRITLTLLESLDLVDLLSQFDTFPHTLLLFLNKVGRIIVDEDVAGGHDIEDSTRVRAEKYLQENEDGQEVKSEQEDVDEQKDEDDQDGKDELDNEDDQGDGDELDNEGEEETAPENRVKSITTYSREFSPNINRAQVTLSVDQTKEPFSYSEAYWITRKTSFNLPTDGQRDYNTAEVILAFPVTDVDGQDWPYIESQEVYAYLPIRDFGFPVSVAEGALFSMLTINSSLFSQILLPRQVGRMSWRMQETKPFLRGWPRRLWMRSYNSASNRFFSIGGRSIFQKTTRFRAPSGPNY
jgi:hypothetical protein